MNILFTDTGWNQYTEWQGQDKKTVKRINQLLKSIDRDGAMQGIGKPEVLKHGKSGLYSRRIDESNRLVYEMSPAKKLTEMYQDVIQELKNLD